MQAGDLIQSARSRYGVSQGSNRWGNTRMLQVLTDSCSAIATEVDFPEAAYPITTVAGQREYQMIDCVKIVRVYLIENGVFAQPLPGTNIPTLEGNLLYIYDQSSGQINGSPAWSPQWMAESSQAYPLMNSGPGQSVVPTALPFFSTTAGAQRGEFYVRGGNIGVVPPPSASGLILAVDHVPHQPILRATQNLMIYPRVYVEALTMKMCEMMADADRSAMAVKFKAGYMEQCPDLRMWKENLIATMPKRITPVTKRTFTRYGDDWDEGWGGY